MRKPAFCICENKAADQLCSNRTADQRLCFRYTDSTTPLLPKSKISSLLLSSVAAQPGLCQTSFLTTRLICRRIFCQFSIKACYGYSLLMLNEEISSSNTYRNGILDFTFI